MAQPTFDEDKRVPLRIFANEMARQLHIMTDMCGDKWIDSSIRMADVVRATLELLAKPKESWDEWQMELYRRAEEHLYLASGLKDDIKRHLCASCLYTNEHLVLHDCSTFALYADSSRTPRD